MRIFISSNDCYIQLGSLFFNVRTKSYIPHFHHAVIHVPPLRNFYKNNQMYFYEYCKVNSNTPQYGNILYTDGESVYYLANNIQMKIYQSSQRIKHIYYWSDNVILLFNNTDNSEILPRFHTFILNDAVKNYIKTTLSN
jgi:hypothetical protein